MIDLVKSINVIAASYVAVHRADALNTVRADINCAIGLREWDKTHILYSIQKRIEQIEDGIRHAA